MNLRQLRPDDWRDLRDIRLEALRDHPGSFFARLEEVTRRTQADWVAMLANPDMASFGLFDGEALAGLTAIYLDKSDPSGATAALGSSFIRPAWRGRGFAARCYAERLAWARERGVARVTVGHRASNEPSRRAMIAAGFVETDRVSYRWPDGTEEDDVRYELQLPR